MKDAHFVLRRDPSLRFGITIRIFYEGIPVAGAEMKITQYSFGRMRIDDRVYRKDLMILPDGSILHPWWRASGHLLTIDDIGAVLDASPAVLVVGTGEPGMMKPDKEFVKKLEKRRIRVTMLPTRQAVEAFNSAVAKGERCAGCFHLTC
jgi:hypothetical protein